MASPPGATCKRLMPVPRRLSSSCSPSCAAAARVNLLLEKVT
jgi:hypothetical protein